ncbi:MAG: HAMP domain-containing sensor histidine kinase [Clostridia bacterium]|nr:HAMP domain-containing sensor histidine kinase [Clostridia bacterium]
MRNKRKLAYRDETILGRVGIRTKILTWLVVLVAFVISLVWLCQIVLTFDIYKNYKTEQITAAADIIADNIDNPELAMLCDRLSGDRDICILLLDDHGNVRISADHVRYCLLHHMSGEQLAERAKKAAESGSPVVELANVIPFINDQYSPEKFRGSVPKDDGDRGMSMLYVRKVNFGRSEGTLFLNAQITPFGTTVRTMRRQFILISCTVLLMTIILGFFMSRSISEPIIETNEAAKRLSAFRYARPPHSGGYREIAELNDTLVRAAEDLSRVEDLQKELIANISHDLRTPLTMIGGYAEVMRDIPEENTPENMQIIIDETSRLSSLVNQVLDYSRIQSGTMRLQPEEMDITDETGLIIQRIAKMTEKDGYTIFFSPETRFTVSADRDAFGQIVYNLIGNALTYTGDDHIVRVSQKKNGGKVRVAVSDSGKGIPPGELPMIWERYYRTADTHRRAVIGSGLGLNIVRGLLEAHGAPYGVESDERTGTTFWFEFDIIREQDGQ